MALSDYVIQTETVPLKGGSLEVRGLGLDDVTVLLRNHMPDLDKLFDLYDETQTDPTKFGETAKYAIKIVSQAPGLVANMIALASDEPDEVEKCRRLPMAAQVKALTAIIKITFEEAGGPKKFYETLRGILLK